MNRLLLLCALVALHAPAFAQDAPLGRLFLTPEQRAALDNARRNKIRSEAVAAAVVKKDKPPAARTVLINGVVKRSDGETIVWVNGKPVEGETPDGMQFKVGPQSQGSVTVREPDRGRRVEIKVGQQVDLVTGRVKETFERPPAAAAAQKVAPQDRGFVSGHARAPRSARDDRDDPPPQEQPAPTEAKPQQ
jgi:hypothetical protein